MTIPTQADLETARSILRQQVGYGPSLSDYDVELIATALSSAKAQGYAEGVREAIKLATHAHTSNDLIHAMLALLPPPAPSTKEDK